jgi:hypothetical protein
MRTLPRLAKEIVEQIEEAWRKPQPDLARKRLLVVRLIAQHEHTVAEIMKIAGVCRQTVFTHRDRVTAGGVKALCSATTAWGFTLRRSAEGRMWLCARNGNGDRPRWQTAPAYPIPKKQFSKKIK